MKPGAIQPIHWATLLGLVTLWGSSYLMVEFALARWSPPQIAGLRIAAAALVLLPAVVLGGRSLPREPAAWGWYLVIALIGNAVPFFLIAWGQQHLESGLAGILAASTPLCVLLLAHYVLPDERLQSRQAVAFLLGFGGIVVLMGPDSLAALGGSGDRLWGQLAVFGGAFCYAVATVCARFVPTSHPVVTSAGVMLLASALMGPWTATGLAASLPVAPRALAALGFLGLLGTGLASILYFYLIVQTGARFTSLLNYLVPVWAVGLGGLVLGETLPTSAWLALAMILGALFLMRGSAPASATRSERRESG
jgi:drug/metabolite transporter (DMT)-like permease